MITTLEDKNYYETLERTIVKEATDNGIPFEEAAKLKRQIQNEGLKDFELYEMLRNRLAEKQKQINT